MFFPTDDLKTDELVLLLRETCDAKPEKRWLPAYYFDICLPDMTKIGRCDLRIGHNDKTYVGGNIGYGIDETFRGHHYAAKACGLLFGLAAKHGMDHVFITCDPTNIASSRTCLAAGGRLVDIVDIPEDNELYADGKRLAMVYRFDIRKEVVDREHVRAIFDKYVAKLRITPPWDVKLEFVEDPEWKKTGDFKIDCDDRKAILLINAANPKQENLDEVIVHELMHIKMYPLDQITESLILSCFPEESPAQELAYTQFFTALEQTVEELTKCFLLESGEDIEFSFGRCRGMKSFNDLYEGLKGIE